MQVVRSRARADVIETVRTRSAQWFRNLIKLTTLLKGKTSNASYNAVLETLSMTMSTYSSGSFSYAARIGLRGGGAICADKPPLAFASSYSRNVLISSSARSIASIIL